MRLGYAAGKVLAGHHESAEHPTVLIGKDTRISGYMLESALQAGLSAAGVDVVLVRPDAHAGGRVSHARAAAFGRHRDQRFAQSVSTTTASNSFPATARSCPTRPSARSKRSSRRR